MVTTDFATSFDEARGLAIQADGKIVTAGLVFVGAPGDFGLAGYLNGAAICGNGNVEPGETCDDGNNANGDGCSSACLVEPGFTCSGEPSSCTLLIAQCQLAKLTADDATSCDRCGDAFGISVSMAPGQLFMTILIPYHAEDLAGSEPLSVD
ncbi:MAG: hypothetical protein IIC51_09920, partial [Planctomycetes bacterium]|nr:hypothetical protein [Planctomycetota bacterium]